MEKIWEEYEKAEKPKEKPKEVKREEIEAEAPPEEALPIETAKKETELPKAEAEIELPEEKPIAVEEKPTTVEAKPPVEEVKPSETKPPEIPAEVPTPEKVEFEAKPAPPVKAISPLRKKAEEEPISEAEAPGKEVYMIYGLKGHGKTTLAMSFPGKVAVLSFDRKALQVKEKMFRNDPRIRVYDAVKFEDDSTPERWLESSEATFIYVNRILDEVAKWQPDWIVIDGSEIFQQVCEMTMRYRNNILPFQGIANLNLWKERRLYIRQVHRKALYAAKRGVIYTTYSDKDEIVQSGEVITKRDVPRWIDAIMYETDTVIKVEAEQSDVGRKFYAIVESSKTGIPSGTKKDVTGVGIRALVK